MILSIPPLGLGTYRIPNDQITDLVVQALEIGYRSIDTAQIYGNEEGIGNAMKQTTLPREQIHLTTKVRMSNYTAPKCCESLEQSLKNLQTEYIDLVLLHRPNTRIGHHEVLDTLMHLKQIGKIRQIGVSNFPITQLQDALQYTDNQIMLNQIELHPLLDQPKLRTYCQENNVLVSAYSPLAHGQIFDNVTLRTIAEKHNASIAQVALAWTALVATGPILPKASTPERLRENFAAQYLMLDADDIAVINALPKTMRTCNPVFHPLWDDLAIS